MKHRHPATYLSCTKKNFLALLNHYRQSSTMIFKHYYLFQVVVSTHLSNWIHLFQVFFTLKNIWNRVYFILLGEIHPPVNWGNISGIQGFLEVNTCETCSLWFFRVPFGSWLVEEVVWLVLCIISSLGGGWSNPFEKYDRQIGSFLQGFGVKKNNIWVATTQIKHDRLSSLRY